MATTGERIGGRRADEVTSTLALGRVIVRRPAMAALAAGAALMLAGRVALGEWSAADALVAVALVLLIGPVEWAVHRYLFHAPPQSRRTRWLGTGVGHRRHHGDPLDLHWLLLQPDGVALFAVALAAVATIVAVPVALAADVAATGLVPVAIATAWLALIRYEVVHLAHHSRRRPWTARGRRIRAHHLAHHHRLPGSRLGVTGVLPDRLFGTMGPTEAAPP